MRIEHVEHRLNQQLETIELLKSAVDNLLKVGSSNVSSHRIETRITALEELWEKFSTTHNAIGIAVAQLNPSDKETILRHKYFQEKLSETAYEIHLEAAQRMKELADENHQTIQRSSSTTSLNYISSQQQLWHRGPRLPRIDLPKFSGTPSEWLPFKDLFVSLVLSNQTLSSVEKLQYLKTSLTGSAEALLKNTSLTADNFQKAWDALEAFYENKRLLVNSALHSLLTLKRMTKESATEMEHLYTSIMQIFRTLETLGRPVQTWDDFLVFVATQRLDSESVKAWEHHLGSSKDPPTWIQFSEFLMTRMLSLKAFEKSRQGKTHHQQQHNSARAHHASHCQDNQAWKSTCPFCSENHYAAKCAQFSNKTTEQKKNLIAKHKLCYNCLGRHRVSTCRSVKRCSKCGQKHHTSIHQAKPLTPKEDSASTSTSAQTNYVSLNKPSLTSFALLATAQVLVSSEHNGKTKARALIDPGSQISFISERLVQHLQLHRSNSSVILHGIGAVKAGKTRGQATVNLSPHFKSTKNCQISAHILPTITSTIPTVRVGDIKKWPHLKGLTLADPHYNTPGRIDILIGSDYYGNIIEEGLKKGEKNTPIAQQTIFGWIISGSPISSQALNNAQGFHVYSDQELHDLLQRFWHLEEIPSSSCSKLSNENQRCEEYFQKTYSRNKDGRYVVKLPLKSSVRKLGESRNNAMKALSSLERRFQHNTKFYKAYSAFLREYESMKHMQRAPESSNTPQPSYYLPHHGVLRESSLTTKLRVVFNGSSRTSTGISLNDLLHTGAKLQTDLNNVLLWFRQFRYVFSSDIEKMYRQILVHPDHWDLQRILWIDEARNILTFQLTTLTYGLACAPFLALRTMRQLIHDEGSQYPLAVPPLTDGRYVDDVFGGADSIKQAQEIVKQTNDLCMAGGFPLQKWTSNHPEVLQNVPPEKCIQPPSIVIDKDATVHALGLCWNPKSDTFHFSIKIRSPTTITKRTILSMIAQIFDPLGFISPVIIRAKIFMQELWSLKVGWDEKLSPQLSSKWMLFFHELEELSHLSVPRWLNLKTESSLEIHGFCDASQLAIAAVVYIRTVTEGVTKTTLACSKSKVAPLKRMTIPRLELTGAVMLTKLVVHIIQVLSISGAPIYMWSDSTIVNTWLNNHPARWKDFVHNRVCLIHESLPSAIWHFIPGKDNPADCATRGLTASKLDQHRLWWTGPPWLIQTPASWPEQPTNLVATEHLEERPAQITTAVTIKSPLMWDLILKYSTLLRLLRVTATCQRAAARFKKIPESSLITPLTTGDIEHAKYFWIKAVQSAYFREEIKILKKGHHLSRSHPLSRLTPYVDKFDFLRVGGRLQSSLLHENSKHPFILPRKSTFTNLVIKDAHLRTLHGGTQSTLSFIKEHFWIVGGRAPVRSFILKCIPCTRYRQKRAEQLMGQLPSDRVTPSRPFLHSGVDYAGPFHLKTWRGRAARSYKAYIALFVCNSTSAIHLELVTDYTSEAFIAAYKRFTARRGICATLRSDCGTNLKGANLELIKLFSSASEEAKQLAYLLSNDGTQWIFNPPSAPHFGGKWEAGVKSVKHHLRRVIGERLMTFEEMYTILTQIEAVLNSRPLCPITEDPDDLSILTPGHFLIGSSPCILPEPSLECEKVTRLSRWQHLRQMLDSFWTKWSKEYLQRLQATSKWKHSSIQLKEGSLVLVMDERYPPAKWALGRIQKLHPGSDGLTRVVTVKTQTSIIKRPIVKICPLPIETDSL